MGFEFFSPPRIVFGRGAVTRLADLVRPLGNKALIVFNGSAQPDVVRLLVSGGVGCVSLRQRGEPTVEDVEHAVELARREVCEVLVGLGGGSAIDTAKAAAGILGNGGAALDYMEVIGKGQLITKPAVPWVAVPTTAGTGAEVTRNAVLGDTFVRILQAAGDRVEVRGDRVGGDDRVAVVGHRRAAWWAVDGVADQDRAGRSVAGDVRA